MKRYADYYNQSRSHLALNKNFPSNKPIERRGIIKPQPIFVDYIIHITESSNW